MDTSHKASSTKDTDSKERSKSKLAVRMLVVIVLLLIASGSTYYWQHKELQDANQTVASLKKSTDQLNKQLASLQSSYEQATDQLNKLKAANEAASNTSQSDLTLNINGSAYFDISGSTNGPHNGLAVNFTLTNPTSQTIYASSNSFKLRDGDDNTYQVNPFGSNLSSLPNGYVMFVDQTLTPGATTKGTIYFQIHDPSIKSFTLLNLEKSYQLTVQ